MVPAAILDRSQPDRAGLREDQTLDADGPETKYRGRMALCRNHRRKILTIWNTETISRTPAMLLIESEPL